MGRDVAANTAREADMLREAVIGEFLDENLYPRIGRAERAAGEGEESIEQQLQGIDVTADIDDVGTGIHIDEKAQIDYINSPAPSFVLELNAYDRGDQLRDGWFYDEEYATEYYLFVWLPDCITFQLINDGELVEVNYRYDSDDPLVEELREKLGGALGEKTVPNDPKIHELLEELTGAFPQPISTGSSSMETEYFCTDHIRQANCLLIERGAIQEHLLEAGYSKSHFEERAEEIRESGRTGKISADHPHFDYYLTPQSTKSEHPLNIVVKYELLHELKEETYIVTASGIQEGQYLH